MTGDRFPHLGFRVSYNGSQFSGMQLQSERPSIQALLEKNLSLLLREDVRIHFSSRTDAGVHSYDQRVVIPNGVQFFKALTIREQKRFISSLNSLCGGQVGVWSMLKLRNDFRVRKDVEWKEYRYRIFNSTVDDPLWVDRAWWIRSPLDVRAMSRVLSELRGLHDFFAFSKTSSSNRRLSTRREILQARLMNEPHPIFSDSKVLTIVLRGDGFLHQMVRRIAALLVAVGRGERDSAKVFLRGRGSPTWGAIAPAEGLTLWHSKVPAKYARPFEGLSS